MKYEIKRKEKKEMCTPLFWLQQKCVGWTSITSGTKSNLFNLQQAMLFLSVASIPN